MLRILTSIILFLFTLLTVGVSNVSAKVVFMEEGNYELGRDEVLNDDLFVGAETVVINGTINGDVYAGGEMVRVSGVINGDLHVGAGAFYLTGQVSEDVYVGAGNVSVDNATIGDSFLIGAGDVVIDNSSSIGGSLIGGTGSINLNSPVERSVLLGAGTVVINSLIGGELRVAGGEISIDGNTRVGKDFYYALSDNEESLNMSQSATVSGQTYRMDNKLGDMQDVERAKNGMRSAFHSANTVVSIISLIGMFIVGYLGLKLFPKTFTGSAKFVSSSFARSLGVGFLITVAALPVIIILVLTGVGTPLAGILFLVLLLNMYLSKIVVSLALGDFASSKLDKKMTAYGSLALGLVLVYLIKMVPFLGFLVGLVILWSGIGALALYYKSTLGGKK